MEITVKHKFPAFLSLQFKRVNRELHPVFLFSRSNTLIFFLDEITQIFFLCSLLNIVQCSRHSNHHQVKCIQFKADHDRKSSSVILNHHQNQTEDLEIALGKKSDGEDEPSERVKE